MKKSTIFALLAGLVFLFFPIAGHAVTIDGFNPDVDGVVSAIAVQDDGKVLIGGVFTTVGGTPRSYIARLNGDGSLDPSFAPPNPDYGVSAIEVQPDGKILIGGGFEWVGTYHRYGIARLNADGTVDTSFASTITGDFRNTAVIKVQADGKILIGGGFTPFGGPHNYIARLNSDGTIDNVFNPAVNGWVGSIAIQGDGKIIIGGGFTEVNVDSMPYVARLNAGGSVDGSFRPEPDGEVYAVALQPDGKILIGGDFGMVGPVIRMNVLRLNTDGSLDTDFNGGPIDKRVTLVSYAEGKVLIGGLFNEVGGVTGVNHLARLSLDGSMDTAFNAGGGLDGNPSAMVVQPDGKILVGGSFTNYIKRLYGDGTPDSPLSMLIDGAVHSVAALSDETVLVGGTFTTIGSEQCPGICRLYAAGGVYPSPINPSRRFFDQVVGSDIRAILVQPDGKIILGGEFTESTFGRGRLARFNTDGSTDASFTIQTNNVDALALQPDGKVLVGGDFTGFSDGSLRNRIARINADGTLDASFDPDVNGAVQAIAVQADGKILIGGMFTTVGGTPRNYLARLNTDGTLDASFAPSTSPGPDRPVHAIAVSAGGKIIVGGEFSVNFIYRINADGTLDPPVRDTDIAGIVRTIVVQQDGKIIAGGQFGHVGPTVRMNLARFNADGTLDTSFDIWTDNTVLALAVQEDGEILFGGDFVNIGDAASPATFSPHLARITTADANVKKLTVDSRTTVTWSRSGGGPACSWVVFQDSADGSNWGLLGQGSSISGGWRITGLSLPGGQDRYVRASCYAPTDGGTSGLQEVSVAYYHFPQLTVATAGSGSGSVQSNPPGIECGGSCSETFDLWESVTLTATPDPGSTLFGWTGCDSTSGNTCTVAANMDRTVIANFAASDTTPDAFTFTDQTGVPLNTLITSNTITVSGIDSPAAISITGGEYSIDSGPFTSSAGTVNNGTTVTLRQTSSETYSTTTNVNLTIGGVSDTFSVTTIAGSGTDATPDPFTFTPQNGVPLNSVATSNEVTITGIDASTAISVVGGEYSVNNNSYTTFIGTITNGSTVRVRQTSSGSYSTTTQTTLTVGGISGTFNVTTMAAPPSGPIPVGYDMNWLVITLASLMLIGVYFVRRRMRSVN
jgi:uncharacterized delta-60 repeat protein